MKITEHIFNGSTIGFSDSYDSTKTVLGSLMVQSGGAVGPSPMLISRMGEAQVGAAYGYITPIRYSATKTLIFAADTATSSSAITRRILLTEHDRSKGTLEQRGFINIVTVPSQASGASAFRAMSAYLYRHNSGTASVTNGSASVTGSDDTWGDQLIAGGARIGFGSNDYSQITKWYEINPATTPVNGSLTLAGPFMEADFNGQYVIEEIRLYLCVTTTTATNGGLFIFKGLNPGCFSACGITIPHTNAADNQRGIYWLKDASTCTNTTAYGIAIEQTSTSTSHTAYVSNIGTATQIQFFKYNLRAALTVDVSVTGASSLSAFVLKTGVHVGTGNIATYRNCCLATLTNADHPAPNTASLYVVTATSARIHRIPVSAITSGNTSLIADSCVENIVGTSTTYTANAAYDGIAWGYDIDRLIITTSGARTRPLIMKYKSSPDPADEIFSYVDRGINHSYSLFDYNSPAIETQYVGVEASPLEGWLYVAGVATSALYDILYALPYYAHYSWAASASQRVITPKLNTPNCNSFGRAYVMRTEWFGSSIAHCRLPEPFKIYYRTSGIDDNTGSWTELTDAMSFFQVMASNTIQFMLEFKLLGHSCLGQKIKSISIVYDDTVVDVGTPAYFDLSHTYPTRSVNAMEFGEPNTIENTNLIVTRPRVVR